MDLAGIWEQCNEPAYSSTYCSFWKLRVGNDHVALAPCRIIATMSISNLILVRNFNTSSFIVIILIITSLTLLLLSKVENPGSQSQVGRIEDSIVGLRV